MMKLSIIIPCYNESKNIPLVLKRVSQGLKRDDVEVILVNNGSTDGSQGILDSLLPECPFARSIKVEVNQGYGFGILSGLLSAKGEFLAWTHADMQTDPLDVIKGLELIGKSPQPEKAFVKGSRRNRPLSDNFFTWGMSIFETVYLKEWLYDINAQPSIFHRSFFEAWDNPPYDFSLDLYVYYMARRHKFVISRFPVIVKKRIYGCSKWNFNWKSRVKFIKRTLDFSYKLKKEHH